MKHFLKRFILIVTLLILTACSAPPTATVTPQPTINVQLADLTQNRQKWDALKVTHYQFKLVDSCFCAYRYQQPISIEVKDGNVVLMLDSNGQPSADQFENTFDSYNTIDKFFSEITAQVYGGAYAISVKYNADYGYPQFIYIDVIENAVDDEINLTITDFQIIK